MAAIPVPDRPLRVALVGAGRRSSSIYRPLLESLTNWLRVVAVCDPVAGHADDLAGKLGADAWTDLRRMVAEVELDAALVVAPVDSHHSISCFLSASGIPHLVETSMASTLTQARQMVDAARRSGVMLRVAENFFRFPVDRIVSRIRAAGDVGPIHRIVSYADHTGYHNSSRWIAFAGAHPMAVQAVEHAMPTASFDSSPERHHSVEAYHARFFWFPDDLLVVDHAANAKGFLGRYPRPGYTEWQGERGTIAWYARRPWHGDGEVRLCSERALTKGSGIADIVCPIVMEYDKESNWKRTYTELPSALVEHVNPFRPAEKAPHVNDWYGAAIMDHIVDFALAVAELRTSEFDDYDALASMEMEVAARESARSEGRRVTLPLGSEIAADRAVHDLLAARLGVDPLDVDAMLGVSFPTP